MPGMIWASVKILMMGVPSVVFSRMASSNRIAPLLDSSGSAYTLSESILLSIDSHFFGEIAAFKPEMLVLRRG